MLSLPTQIGSYEEQPRSLDGALDEAPLEPLPLGVEVDEGQAPMNAQRADAHELEKNANAIPTNLAQANDVCRIRVNSVAQARTPRQKFWLASRHTEPLYSV